MGCLICCEKHRTGKTYTYTQCADTAEQERESKQDVSVRWFAAASEVARSVRATPAGNGASHYYQEFAMPMESTAKRPADKADDSSAKRQSTEDAALIERLRHGIEFIDSHYLGLSWDDKAKKLMEFDSILASCSEARVKQIVEQIAQEAADKRAAEDAAARVAMAARPHESGTVWAVQLDPYNKYRETKSELHSTHLTEQAATETAKRWWTTDTFGVDGFTVLSRPDEPYEANACIEGGGGIMTVAVVRVKVSKLKGAMLREALRQRGAPTGGSTTALRQRLQELVA